MHIYMRDSYTEKASNAILMDNCLEEIYSFYKKNFDFVNGIDKCEDSYEVSNSIMEINSLSFMNMAILCRDGWGKEVPPTVALFNILKDKVNIKFMDSIYNKHNLSFNVYGSSLQGYEIVEKFEEYINFIKMISGLPLKETLRKTIETKFQKLKDQLYGRLLSLLEEINFYDVNEKIIISKFIEDNRFAYDKKSLERMIFLLSIFNYIYTRKYLVEDIPDSKNYDNPHINARVKYLERNFLSLRKITRTKPTIEISKNVREECGFGDKEFNQIIDILDLELLEN